MILKRLLERVTLRRVLAALLVFAFAPEIFSLLSWLAGIGWDLKDVATLQALALSSVQLLLEAAAIYLAARGLRAALERCWRPREGGGNGHGPDVS